MHAYQQIVRLIDRRTFIATLAITLLFMLGWHKAADVAASIMTIAVALGAVNATEKAFTARNAKGDKDASMDNK